MNSLRVHSGRGFRPPTATTAWSPVLLRAGRARQSLYRRAAAKDECQPCEHSGWQPLLCLRRRQLTQTHISLLSVIIPKALTQSYAYILIHFIRNALVLMTITKNNKWSKIIRIIDHTRCVTVLIIS